MKRKTTRLLLGAFLTAALIASANVFANAPNATTATANFQASSFVPNLGNTDAISIGQNNIVEACTATVTGGTLVYAIVPLAANQDASFVGNAQDVAGYINNDVALNTITEAATHDAIFEMSASVSAMIVNRLGPNIMKEAHGDVIFEIAGSTIIGT